MLFKWKSICLVISIFITFAIIISVYQNKLTYGGNTKEDGLLLIETLKGTKVEAEKILLNYTSEISSEEKVENIHTFKTNIEQAFSIDLSLTSDLNQEDIIKYEGIRTISTSLLTKLRIVWVGVPVDNTTNNRKYKTYIAVSLVSDGWSDEGYLKNFDFMSQSLQALSIKPEVKINLQGNMNKQVSHGEQQQMINKMFSYLEASVTEGLNEQEVISLTGYSNLLSSSIESNGTPINVQIASRYDPINKKTKFTIGTPVITMEY